MPVYCIAVIYQGIVAIAYLLMYACFEHYLVYITRTCVPELPPRKLACPAPDTPGITIALLGPRGQRRIECCATPLAKGRCSSGGVFA